MMESRTSWITMTESPMVKDRAVRMPTREAVMAPIMVMPMMEQHRATLSITPEAYSLPMALLPSS